MNRLLTKRWLGALALGCLACTAQGAALELPARSAPRPASAAPPTRLLSQPAIHGDQIAFLYLGDLWTSKRDGSELLRLTSIPGDEGRPHFSPDGQRIAFSANYDGNEDVYTIPTAGGEPTRLTWHPGPDLVRGFSPDGKRVLFASQRAVYWRTMLKLYSVPSEGGRPEELPLPSVWMASMSPDGQRIAYTPQLPADGTWKGYRGGRTSRIWICSLDDLSVEELPQPEGRCNDTDPMWVDGTLYFRSDREGEYNIYRYDGQKVERLTDHEDFPVLAASSDGSSVIYEQAGWLHSFSPGQQVSTQLAIHVPDEGLALRPHFASGAQWLRNAHISPSGKRAVLEYRGEIVSVPAKRGNSRNLTHSPGTHERSPAWSPDGRTIALFSDAGGEYALHLIQSDGQGEERVLDLVGAGFYTSPSWSPDSKRISYTDNSGSLYVIKVEDGSCQRISSEPYYGPSNSISSDWSPDSKWLAYTQGTDANQTTIQVYDLEHQSSHAITDGLSLVGSPAFDASGKYLYFTASTDAGATATWFAMSNADAQSSNELYLAVLSSETPSPFAPESDEEPFEEETKGKAATESEDATEEEPVDGTNEEAHEVEVAIDFDALNERILFLPSEGQSAYNLQAGNEGQLYFISTGADGSSSLNLFELDGQKETQLSQGASGFVLSADRSKLLVAHDSSLQIADAGAPVAPADGSLDIHDLKVRVDPRDEWRQIYHEAWRINRDFFYDPNMHGADWDALGKKYAAFLPDVRSRADLNRVIQWLLSELSVGHHGVHGGDLPAGGTSVQVGLLGADYAVREGHYVFSKVYGGLNWNPGLASPLTEPGVEVHAGDFLLAIDGRELAADDNIFARFENTVGRSVELRVASRSDGQDARTVVVRPISNESALRNRDWVEGNYQRVTEATEGRVAYVHVPDTGGGGHQYFKRYFYPQADRQALIVDDRHNRGGQVADYVIDTLRRPYIASWATRYGKDYVTPHAAIFGPKVMLINEHSSSGGDLLPWMFHKLELGTLVGRRTWGGLVGILGFPVLMDGGNLQAPNIGFWTEDEGFAVENVGVPADVEVNMYPADCQAGRDPQLERAIEIALEELAANPVAKPKRPAFPLRARR